MNAQRRCRIDISLRNWNGHKLVHEIVLMNQNRIEWAINIYTTQTQKPKIEIHWITIHTQSNRNYITLLSLSRLVPLLASFHFHSVIINLTWIQCSNFIVVILFDVEMYRIVSSLSLPISFPLSGVSMYSPSGSYRTHHDTTEFVRQSRFALTLDTIIEMILRQV